MRLSPPPAPPAATGATGAADAAAADSTAAASAEGSPATKLGGLVLEFEEGNKDVLGEGREVAEVITVRSAGWMVGEREIEGGGGDHVCCC